MVLLRLPLQTQLLALLRMLPRKSTDVARIAILLRKDRKTDLRDLVEALAVAIRLAAVMVVATDLNRKAAGADIMVLPQRVKDTVPSPVSAVTVKEATVANRDTVSKEDIPTKQATAKEPPDTNSTARPAMARSKASPAATPPNSLSTPPLKHSPPSLRNQTPSCPCRATECSKRPPQPALGRLSHPARPADMARQPRPGTASSNMPPVTQRRCPKRERTVAMGKRRATTAAKNRTTVPCLAPRPNG
mmetsp:Transcript_26716/g.46069  ORF Transcript_26716/g.46069 Transcript_26716/m.46069 type:complete len:247 (+) Transcript_26716:190-930(+)